MNIDMLLDLVEAMPVSDAPASTPIAKQMRVTDRTLAYTARHRGEWHKPDPSFAEINIMRKTDGYAFRATQKKVNRVMVAGWELVGKSKEARDYLLRRLAEMAWATQTPTDLLIEQTMDALFTIDNCVWIKKRSAELSSGLARLHFGKELEPVAGYFVVDFDTMELKTKKNGEPKKWRQVDPATRETKEFFPHDVIHFRSNQFAGYTVGFPELFPALDDIALLRRIEENVEDLIEANLFPLFHYKVGNDNFPETMGPDGRRESEIVQETVEYMPAGGIYISDHRHSIEAIGSEGRALRIDYYLSYFRNRALASLGSSSLDMGESDTSNRSTASTLSKSTLLDVEAKTKIFKRYFDFFVINELLLEGGYDPLDPENRVEIRFGVIDKEDRRADENQVLQMFTNNAITVDEMRTQLGHEPWDDEKFERTFFHLYGEPAALLKGMGPGSAAGQALARRESSGITPEDVAHEERHTAQVAKAQAAARGQPGRPASRGNGTVGNRSRPANQYGARSAPKTTRDYALTDGENQHTFACADEIDAVTLEEINRKAVSMWRLVKDTGIKFSTVVYNIRPELEPK
jgi:hypothetical protein